MAKTNHQITITKLQLIGSITVAVITCIGTYLAGGGSGSSSPGVTVIQNNGTNNVVPVAVTKSVNDLPESTPSGNYEVLKDMSMYDLRSWKPTPDSLLDSRYSPVNYINYLHVKKLKDIDKFSAHYATSGFAIDMRCITHKFTILKEEKPGVHQGHTRYAVEVDVSDVAVNEEFLIVIEATYWNGFSDVLRQEASTYTDGDVSDLEEISLIVFLPESKPFKSYELRRQREGRPEEQFTYDIGTLYPDEGKRFIYWSVGNITPDTHYKVVWEW